MHRTPSWDPVPGTFADRRELDALADALAAEGAACSRSCRTAAPEKTPPAWRASSSGWTRWRAAAGGPSAYGGAEHRLPGRLARRHPHGRAGDGARRQIAPQIAVRSVGLLFGFGISISPLSLYPAAGELLGKPLDEQRAALHRPEVMARLRDSIAETSGDILGGMATLEHVFPLEDIGVRAYETTPDRNLVAIGRRQGVHPLEVMLDLIVRSDARCFFLAPLFNCDLEAAGEMVKNPHTTIGLGDSGAHTSQTSDAGYATFTLAYWVRERGLLSVEQAVKKLSADPAALWGLRDRGVLRAGAYADLNVIDLERLDLRPPEVLHDFPAGAPHLHQGACGYEMTVVNGKVLMRGGAHSGAHPGRVLRNEKARA